MMNDTTGRSDRKDMNWITGQIVDAAMRVHTALGPGLLESAYEACLLFELHRRGLKALAQVELPVFYEGVRIDVGYRMRIATTTTVFGWFVRRVRRDARSVAFRDAAAAYVDGQACVRVSR